MDPTERAGHAIRERAERAVAECAARNGARLISGVLLDLEHKLESYSFILIDRYGLTSIDLQVLPSATVSGGSDMRQWRAVLPGEKPLRFENPLDARNRRIDTLQRVLAACGRGVAPEYVTDFVVLAGADLSGIKLTAVESMVVIGDDAISSVIDARYDFPPNSGLLDPGEISDLESLFHTLNRADDAQAVARFESQLNDRPSLADRLVPSRKGVPSAVAISDSAAGVAPVAIRVSEDRYPVGGAQARGRGRRTSPVSVVVLAGLMMLAVWMLAFGGYSTLLGAVDRFSPSGGSAVQQPTPVDAQLETAKQVLRDTDPDLYRSVVNLDEPLTNSAEDYRLYTWEYIQPDGSSGSITLTFDASGTLRGANRQ